jgi:hypothetical protein
VRRQRPRNVILALAALKNDLEGEIVRRATGLPRAGSTSFVRLIQQLLPARRKLALKMLRRLGAGKVDGVAAQPLRLSHVARVWSAVKASEQTADSGRAAHDSCTSSVSITTAIPNPCNRQHLQSDDYFFDSRQRRGYSSRPKKSTRKSMSPQLPSTVSRGGEERKGHDRHTTAKTST